MTIMTAKGFWHRTKTQPYPDLSPPESVSGPKTGLVVTGGGAPPAAGGGATIVDFANRPDVTDELTHHITPSQTAGDETGFSINDDENEIVTDGASTDVHIWSNLETADQQIFRLMI